ncbi:MAG: hypothetical protein R2789_11375 [Microthrixaceae bacterium]
MTTQGMGVDDMSTIADLMARVLRAPEDDSVIDSVRGEVAISAAATSRIPETCQRTVWRPHRSRIPTAPSGADRLRAWAATWR